MTVDFVEIQGLMYEVIEHQGHLFCEGEPCDYYVDHDEQKIVYSNTIPRWQRMSMLGRAVTESWQLRAHPAPLKMAAVSAP